MEDNLKEIELRTFNETPSSDTTQNKDLNDSTLCFENQDYLSMSSGVDPLNDGTGSLGNGYEEMKYENMILPPPTTYDDVETHTADSGVYENCPPSNSSGHTADKPVDIIKKLRIGKSTYSFWKYSIFVVNVICKEVELLIYLDIFYILAGLLLLGFAGTHTEPPHLMQHVDVVSALRLLVQQNKVVAPDGNTVIHSTVRNFNDCPLSASLDYLVFCYAGCAIISGGINISMKCQPRPSIYHVFETTAYRSVRILMIICCLLGLVEVYVRFPPEEYDTKRSNYCSPIWYWSVVYIFTLTASIVAVIIVHIIIAFVWYSL